VDESEQEQWENLKRWLRNNGPQVAILVAVMLLGWYGWKWWQGRGAEDALAAGASYQKILATFDDGKPAEAVALIETLRSEHPDSPYVGAADMVAARVYVEDNQLDKAAAQLKRVADSAKDEKLRPVAQLRLARVQSAMGQYDVALATLGTKTLGEHEAARLEVRGDVLLAKGDRAGALAEYEAARKLQPALDDGSNEGTVAELLSLKIADLQSGSAVTSTAAPAAAVEPAAAAAPAVSKP
jgi:predicted negative regulator of RcsB-dependent stress response